MSNIEDFLTSFARTVLSVSGARDPNRFIVAITGGLTVAAILPPVGREFIEYALGRILADLSMTTGVFGGLFIAFLIKRAPAVREGDMRAFELIDEACRRSHMTEAERRSLYRMMINKISDAYQPDKDANVDINSFVKVGLSDPEAPDS